MAQMQIYVQQRRSAGALGDYVAVPDLLDNGSGFHIASLTARSTSSVVAGLPFGFRSAVTWPDASTLPMAAFTAAASCIRQNVYSSIAATLPMAPSGFALFCPAISGAD